MRECNICGYKKISEEYGYCPNCGVNFAITEKKEIDSEHVKLWGGESRLATLFFVNFISTEQKLDKATTRQNVIYLSEAMQEIENIIKKYDGTANRILPDNRILGAFGIPRAHKDDPERALRCVMEIKQYSQDKIQKKEFGAWEISIGINTGWVFFGYVIEKLSYLTIIGDTVNVAARLTQVCPPGNIYLSSATYENVAQIIDVDVVGERAVKGRTETVKIYGLKGFHEEKQTSYASRYPLLGREKEFEKLLNLAREVKENNQLRLCAIMGQMGIGKTRLKEEFRDYILKDGSYKVFESYCAVEIHTPYYPFKLLFREYLSIKELDSHAKIIQKIEDFVSKNNLSIQDAQGLKHLFVTDLHRVWGDTVMKIQEEIFSATKNFLKVACQNAALILIFEEFNRADDLSKALVSYLTNELSNLPIFILMVNFVEGSSGKLNAPLEVVNLGPLDPEAVGRLVKYILNDVDEKLVDFIYRISGGNPLFTIETIRSVQRTEMIKQKESGQWYLEKQKRLPFLDDLYGVVMSGIDSLSSAHRLIIDYAAVIGYSFTHQVIASLLSNVIDLQERLEYLKTEDYIVQFRGGEDPVYIFRHNLLRDAVYTTLPMRKRKEIHSRVGELLENIYAENLSEFYENLGQQFLSCEKFTKAAHYFKLSADKAKALFSIDPAMNYYNTVLKIEDEHPGTVDFDKVCDCRLNLADLYELKGDIQRMKAIAELGRESTRKTDMLKWNIYFTERLGFAHYLLNEYKNAEELFITAVQQCNEQLPEILSILYTDLGMLYLAKNEPEKSLLNYNLAWVTTRGNNLKEGEFACLLNLSRMHSNLGNFELCLEYLNYALTELLQESEILRVAEVKYLMGDVNYHLWNLGRAQEYFQTAFNLTEQIGVETTIKSALYLSFINSILKKEKETLYYLDFVDKKISLLVREGLLAEINLKKALSLYNLNQNDRARELVNNALKIAVKLNIKEIEFFSKLLLARFDTDEKETFLKDALQIAETLKFPPLIGQALFELARYFLDNQNLENARYFGRKALFVYDDIKARLRPENREYFIQHPEYSKLLEL